MKGTVDGDIRRLMEKSSPRMILLSFAAALVYAAVAALACMAGREMIETVARKILAGMALQANQYAGYAHLTTITAAGLMVVVWLATFLIVWNRIEKSESAKARLRIGALWIGGAVAAYLVFSLVQLFAVGCWPLLTGAA